MDADTKRLMDQVDIVMEAQKAYFTSRRTLSGNSSDLLSKSKHEESKLRKLSADLKRGQNLLPFSD